MSTIYRPGDPENLNDLGEVFMARCWQTHDEGCGWSFGPGAWTPTYQALDKHESDCGHLGEIERVPA